MLSFPTAGESRVGSAASQASALATPNDRMTRASLHDLAASATMLVSLTACGDDGSESSASGDGVESSAASTKDCPESTDAVVSDAGSTSRRLLKLSPTPGDTTALEQMASFTFPLPTEPVGVGAEWAVDNSFELSGVVSCKT
jgi:hypothetical protein